MKFLAGDEKSFIEFISNIDDKDKVGIISHTDSDGLVSALLFNKILGEVELIEFVNYGKDWLKEAKKKINNKEINKVIILDLHVDEAESDIKTIAKKAELLIMDHHQWDKNINSDKITFLLTEQKNTPSLAGYKLLNKFQSLNNLDFLVGIALINDYCFENNKKFLSKLEKKYNITAKEFNSELGEYAKIVANTLIYFEPNLKKAYQELKKVDRLEKIDKLKQYSNKVEREIERINNDFDKNKEVHDWGYYYYLDSKFRIGSVFSTRKSRENPEKLFIIAKYRDGEISVNAKQQDGKVNCSKVLKKAIEGIPESNAGGHKPAAGAEMPKQYLEKFKQNLNKVMKNERNNL